MCFLFDDRGLLVCKCVASPGLLGWRGGDGRSRCMGHFYLVGWGRVLNAQHAVEPGAACDAAQCQNDKQKDHDPFFHIVFPEEWLGGGNIPG